MRTKKGEIWISVVIYVLSIIIVMVLVLEAGIPILNKLNDKNTFKKVKDTMISLDQHIVDIANEGQGSQRVIPLEVPNGDIEIKNEKMIWKIETGTKLMEPRSRVTQGNLVISSEVDVSAKEYPGSYIIENSIILINITRQGAQENWTNVDTGALINYTEFKEQTARTAGTFSFILQNNPSSALGTGYTRLVEQGTKLTTGVVITHVNSTSYEYDLKISLDSKSDFFRASIENFRVK
ncbi:hypothetical protein HYU11_03700 [Candidatus Woesearchaeota archaeon]|nr:hypothetical protein [Candidatus Woesearchaeota archaeon]